jgi:hypothetical protein
MQSFLVLPPLVALVATFRQFLEAMDQFTERTNVNEPDCIAVRNFSKSITALPSCSFA